MLCVDPRGATLREKRKPTSLFHRLHHQDLLDLCCPSALLYIKIGAAPPAYSQGKPYVLRAFGITKTD